MWQERVNLNNLRLGNSKLMARILLFLAIDVANGFIKKEMWQMLAIFSMPTKVTLDYDKRGLFLGS